jgi:hypothetical protein
MIPFLVPLSVALALVDAILAGALFVENGGGDPDVSLKEVHSEQTMIDCSGSWQQQPTRRPGH